MGCDFDIQIQVLYGGKWVTIISLYDRTSTGGYPLTDAMWSVLKHKGLHGTYGLDSPECGNLPVLWQSESPIQTKSHHVVVKNSGDANAVGDKEEDFSEDSDNEDHVNPDQKKAFYSQEEFRNFTRYCGPSFMNRMTLQRSNEHKEYLKQIPMWMDLARFAYPVKKNSMIGTENICMLFLVC